MLITKVKNTEELDLFFKSKPVIIKCFGCKEVYFPEQEINKIIDEKKETVSDVIRLDYLCREDFSKIYIEKKSKKIEKSGTVIVFSCGVGVQVIAKIIEQVCVFAGCDTFDLNGFQGLSIQENDCEQCGECYLNLTGGICPITTCSKNLLNGPCGGYKDGKCEVSNQMECGWVRIYERLKNQQDKELIKKISIRNYQRYITESPKLT
jgi:electron transport complex protein RnfC